MSSLSHVVMWTEELGYRPVTLEEATEKYPSTVSARSKIFVCEICHQGVTLTFGKVRVRHFRHDSKPDDKSCKERTPTSDNSLRSTRVFSENLHELPCRIVFQQGSPYRIELGLLALTEELWEKYKEQFLKITTDCGDTFQYYVADRIRQGQVTYLNVGAIPSRKYLLEIAGSFPLPAFWPRRANGLQDITLFDGKTGKKLPDSPDVEIQHEYIVALADGFLLPEENEIVASKIPTNEHGWRKWTLYRVMAKSFSRESAHFFLQLRARLTRRLPSVFPLWPAFVCTPHLIYHSAREFCIFIEGDDTQTRIFPVCNIEPIIKEDSAQLIFCSPGGEEQTFTASASFQLLELGHSHVLRYDYFFHNNLTLQISLPEVQVMDENNVPIVKDQVYETSFKRKVRIKSFFDGMVKLEKAGKPTDRYSIKGGELLELAVNTGQTLSIFQGLDLIRTIVFYRLGSGKNIVVDDVQLSRKLKRFVGDEVAAIHAIAKFAYYFRNCRVTGAWLRKKKEKGIISSRALALLSKIFGKTFAAHTGGNDGQ